MRKNTNKIANTRVARIMHCISQENHAKVIAKLQRHPMTVRDVYTLLNVTQVAACRMLSRFMELGIATRKVANERQGKRGVNPHTYTFNPEIYSVIRQYANEMLLKQPDEVKVVQFKHWRKAA